MHRVAPLTTSSQHQTFAGKNIPQQLALPLRHVKLRHILGSHAGLTFVKVHLKLSKLQLVRGLHQR